MTFAQTRPASRFDLSQTAPQAPGEWIMRGANFVVVYASLPAGATLKRDNPDESIVYFPDGMARIEAGGDVVEFGAAATVVILPPGPGLIEMTGAGRVLRLFSSAAQNLAAMAANADIYADGAPEVAPMRPWPEPHDGFKLRHYRVEDYRDRPMRMFRSANLMINIFDFDGPRNIMALSPHSHADFEQGSFAMSGEWVHSLRYPWSKQLPDWREDEHLAIGSPSLLVIPATVIHTSRSTAPGGNQLVDIFSPPRRDFCDLGYVCNGAEYPVAETEGDKE